MIKIKSQLPFVLAGFIGGVAFMMGFGGIGTSINAGKENNANGGYVTINDAQAGSLPQVKDQMVCHAGKILPVLNQNHSTKSLTCMKKSTRKNQGYNSLAEIFAEEWVVIDINNNNVWLFYK